MVVFTLLFVILIQIFYDVFFLIWKASYRDDSSYLFGYLLNDGLYPFLSLFERVEYPGFEPSANFLEEALDWVQPRRRTAPGRPRAVG